MTESLPKRSARCPGHRPCQNLETGWGGLKIVFEKLSLKRILLMKKIFLVLILLLRMDQFVSGREIDNERVRLERSTTRHCGYGLAAVACFGPLFFVH